MKFNTRCEKMFFLDCEQEKEKKELKKLTKTQNGYLKVKRRVNYIRKKLQLIETEIFFEVKNNTPLDEHMKFFKQTTTGGFVPFPNSLPFKGEK